MFSANKARNGHHAIFFLLSLLAFNLLLLLPTSAFAEMNDTYAETSIHVFGSYGEAQSYFETLENNTDEDEGINLSSGNLTYTNLSLFIVRNGSTKRCELYLHWTGTDLYNAFRFTKLFIDNGSSLNTTIYAKLGTGLSYTTYNVTAAKTGSRYLTNFNLDTNITTVRGRIYSLQGYNLTKSNWYSAVTWNQYIGV